MTGRELTAYNEKWAKQAEQYAAQEQITGGTFLSTRGGTLCVGDEAMPGNQVCVLVLDAVMENTLYAEKFDADNKASPICYAFGRDAEEMAPHPSMQVDLSYFKPQHATCQGCPNNEWGSADQGRGKACQNRRRLALLPAGIYTAKRQSRDFDLDLFDDPKHYQQADICYLKLPVTSIKAWSKYVNQIAQSVNRPPHGVITRVWLEPNQKNQFEVKFEMLDMVPDELFDVVQGRHEEAVKAVIQGYSVPPEREVQQTGSLRGLRRQR